MRRIVAGLALVFAVALGACDSRPVHGGGDDSVADSDPEGSSEGYESDDPRLDGLSGRDRDELECEEAPFESQRAVREASRVASRGDIFFAISPRGLTSIDTTDTANVRVLDRDLSIAAPVDVALLSDDVALVISDPREDQCASREYKVALTTFDVSDPADIQELAHQQLEGAYTGMQRVGGVLYVMTTGDLVTATVTAFDVSEPGALLRTNSRAFAAEHDVSEAPKLVATSTRLYAAVQRSDGHVDIHVVPLGEANGALSTAATFECQGWLDPGAQLDEHEGILRVLSRNDREAPDWALETFAISDDHQPTALARIDLLDLQDMVFDGARAYALSGKWSVEDALASYEWRPIDLQDPMAPHVAEPLDLPDQSISSLVPLTNRVLALSENRASDGKVDGLRLTLFDVSDPSAPVRADDRVFEGQAGWVTAVSAQADLVALQLSSAAVGVPACQDPIVQLVDLGGDSLAVRGTAALTAPASLRFRSGRLLALTYDSAEVFAVDDRDAPVRIGDLALARHVETTARVGGQRVVVGTGHGTRSMFLDLHDLGLEPGSPSIGSVQWEPPRCFYGRVALQLNTDDSRVHVLYEEWGSGVVRRVATVDISDPTNPRLESDRVIGFDLIPDPAVDSEYWPTVAAPIGHGFLQISQTRAGAAMLHLLVHAPGSASPARGELALADSAEPHTLQVRGDSIYVGRMQAREGESRVWFFVDRIDIDDPTAPEIAGTYSVPGRLLNVLDDGRLLTLSHRRTQSNVGDESTCFERGGLVVDEPDEDETSCVVFEETLNLVRFAAGSFELEAQYTLQDGGRLIESTIDERRAFVRVAHSYDDTSSSGEVLVLSGLDDGRLDPEPCSAANAATCEPSDSGDLALGYAGFVSLD